MATDPQAPELVPIADRDARADSHTRPRTAIVHHWFVRRGGAERVVEELAALFPAADLFSLVVAPSGLGPSLAHRKIQTSFLQRFPFSRRAHRFFMPLYPLALEGLDLSGYDLVVSSESGPSKGVLTRSDCCHICYCHSPMRYIWDMHHQYRKTMPLRWLTGSAFALASHYLRLWDYATAARVDFFAASSANAAGRIRRIYGRDAVVIHPPVDIGRFSLDPERQPGDYYLVVGRLVAYKRTDLAIEVCNRMQRRLVVIGEGEERRALARLAGPLVEFRDAADDAEVQHYMRHCRALLFPQEEDIGLVPVEVQACGRPVIAFGRGGALETVLPLHARARVDDATGVLFDEQTPDALEAAIRQFEAVEEQWQPHRIRAHAERFSHQRFDREFSSFVEECMRRKGRAPHARAAAAP